MYIDALTIAGLMFTVVVITGIIGLCSRVGNGCASGNEPVHSRRPSR